MLKNSIGERYDGRALKIIEQQLLGDDELDFDGSKPFSINTNSEWSHSQLIPNFMIDPIVLPAPTSSFSSSCSSTLASPLLFDLKQSSINTVVTISNGKKESLPKTCRASSIWPMRVAIHG